MPLMPQVTIYTTSSCPYCTRAKHLLGTKGVAFNEIDVGRTPERRAEMETKSGRYTVPQIWIGERHIGGCDDLYALDQRGGLDPLLAG
jgi:glutaredoxin 3